MASKTRSEAGSRTGDIAAVLDRLYAAPLETFVAQRQEMAAALRAAGDVAGARLLRAASKPSRTAWALNQVARRQPGTLKAALEARAKAAEAQTSGEGEALRTTARAYRDRLADVVQAAGDAAREDGAELTVAQGRRISATVQAIAAEDDAAAHEALLAGRLVVDVDLGDPFAGLEAGPMPERPATERSVRKRADEEGAPEPPESAPRDDLAARRAVAEAGRAKVAKDKDGGAAEVARAREELARERERKREDELRERERLARERETEKLRERVAALEVAAREGRAAAREAEVTAHRAQADAVRSRRAVEELEKRLSEAREELRARG